MSKLGIVGVTGVVGNKFLEVIDEYNLVFEEIKLFASKKSEGKIIHKTRGISTFFEIPLFIYSCL